MNEIEQKLRRAGDPMLLIDLQGNILWRNTAATQIFHNNPTNLSKVILHTDIKRILNARHIQSSEVTLCDQQSRMTAVVLDVSGSDPSDGHMLLSFKLVESLEDNLKRREEWLTTVAHDIKNPIGAVFGFADAILDTPIGAGINQEQRRLLIRIRASASRALELVKNVQHLSALEVRGITQSSSLLDINNALMQAIDSVWRQDEMMPALRVHLDPSSPKARIEAAHFERILANLISNALKYSPANEEVSVATKSLEQHVQIAVHNKGQPIPPTELPLLFKQNQRLSTSRGTSGSGIGLFVVKKIVDGVGGEITVRSDAANGTTFTLIL